jgi:hypothetical protein
MTTLANLLALLSLDNAPYLDGLTGSETATSSFSDKMANMGGAVVVGGLTLAGAAIAAVGAAAWDAGNTIDGAMDSIAVKTGATGPALQGLQKDFETVFQSVPTDAQTTADVIGVLNARLDASGPALQGLATPLLQTSQLLGGDVTTRAENFSRVMGDWNLPLESASSNLDSLYVAAQQTGAPLDNLMQRIVQYGAPMRGFGMSFEESAALLSKWEAEGVNVETVMGGMRIAAGKFAKDGKDMAVGLWDTVDAITNAQSSTEALTIATDIFGSKSAVDMVDTIRSGKFDIDALTLAMQNADGAISNGAQSTADWGEKWTAFQNQMTVALAPLGQEMMAGVGAALDQVVAIFNRPDVQTSLKAFSALVVNVINQVVAKIPDMINGLLELVGFLQNNQGIVVGIFAALGVAATTWGVVTAAAAWAAISPLLPVIAVLVAIGAAVYLLYEAWQSNFGGMRDKGMALWAWLQPMLSQLWTWLSVNIPAAIKTASAFWTNTLLPGIMAVWSWINANLVPLFSAIINVWLAGWKKELTALSGLWQNVLLPALTKFASFMTTNVFPVIKQASDWFGAKLGPALDGISTAIADVVSWLGEMATMIDNLTLPDWLTPGSPTPWEIALWGLGDALNNLSSSELPALSAELRLQPAGVALNPAAMVNSAVANVSGPVVVNLQYAPTISTASEAEARNVLAPYIEAEIRRREKR